MSDTREYRTFHVDLRAMEGASPKIDGYAAVYNSNSEEMGFYDKFVERITPGAFDGVLGNDVRLLVNHDPNFVLARTKSGTLQLSADAKGLRAQGTPPDTQWARDLMVSMKRGDIDQMSFGFTVADEHVEKDGAVRVIDRIGRLFDVSVVTFPAYPATTVQARARKGSVRQIELDSALIAAIAQVDAMVDDLDEFVDTLMDDLGIPDPDEAGEVEEDSLSAVPTTEAQVRAPLVVRPRMIPWGQARLKRRLTAARVFERTLRPRKEP